MKKAIVIGALGFVGYGLCCRLLENEVNVYAIDFSPQQATLEEEKLLQIGRHANLQFIGIHERVLEDESMKEIDVVFYPLLDHIIRDNNEDVMEFERIVKTVDFCKKNKCKFILLSTNCLEKDALDSVEGEPRGPEETYVRSQTQLDYVIVRLPTIYGPWQPDHFLYQKAILATIDNKNLHFKVVEDTSDLLYIDDALDGVLQIVYEWKTQKLYQLVSGLEEQWYKGMKLISANITIDEVKQDVSDLLKYSDTYMIQKPKTSMEKGIKKQIEFAKWMKRRFN